MNITVIGTGYVGLVTGSCFSYTGNNVICLDVDKDKINDLQQGKIPIYEPGLDKIIDCCIENSCLTFSCNVKKSIQNSDIIFLAVGTPMKRNGSSDLSYIKKAGKDIGKYINKHKIVITKSTIPVGTTYKIKKIIQDEIDKRKENIKFDIANNPEFLKQGKAVNDFISPNRIIVGVENKKNRKLFKKLYKPFSINHEKLIFMDIKSSELTKYAANAMLATKISFINEMSNIAERVGADINEVRLGIGSDDRIGYKFIYPSVGYGGSCFQKDINAIVHSSKKYGYKPEIINAVNKVNENQKKYFFNKLYKRFKTRENNFKNKKFGIWGLSFKPGTDDMRDAASIYFVENIIKLKGKVSVYDPKAMGNAKKKYFSNLSGIKYCKNKMNVLENSDALILLTEWPEFRSPNFKSIKDKLENPIIFDGRNQFDKHDMKKTGFEYHQIGVPLLEDN